ncbi:MAG TPA: GntR family transcriptional regulator [Terriglobia bacterium]|nr:GntR family transcriptional regulator [Terriglobia bacterium]
MPGKQTKSIGIHKAASVFSELQHYSLPRAISEKIHFAILSGTLHPGQRITEIETCQAMGVSRASIREAFQQLRALGVLTARRRKTYVSGGPERGEIHDLYRFRGICEGLAAQAAKDHLEKPDLARLETLILEMESASRKMDIGAFGKADLEFHNLIWQANGKEYLKRILSVITVPYHPFLVALLRKSGSSALLRMTVWHRKALDDLRRFSGENLRRRTELHYQKVGEEFLALMRPKTKKKSSARRVRAGRVR